MRIQLLAGLALGALLVAPALAQDPPQAEAPAAAPAEASLEAFARATVKLNALRQQGPADQDAMAEIIEAEGLSVEQYNAVTARMQADAEFGARVQEALRQAVTAAQPQAQAQPEARAPVTPAVPRPTSGPGAVLLDVIERVCVPMVRGGDRQQLARAVGMRVQRRQTAMSLGARNHHITVEPQGSNRHVCELTIQHAPGQDQVFTDALHAWAVTQQPLLEPYRSDIRPDPVTGNQLTTRSWEHVGQGKATALVYVEERRPDGGSVGRDFDRAKVLYSEQETG